MIRFYRYGPDFTQLEFGRMILYYSFKMPFAYKTPEHGLRISKDAFNGNWGSITKLHVQELLISQKKYLLSEKEIFKFNMNDQFKRTILKMANDIAKKGLGLC